MKDEEIKHDIDNFSGDTIENHDKYQIKHALQAELTLYYCTSTMTNQLLSLFCYY